MLTTVELLNRVKAAYKLPSDYALAKKLSFSRQRISKYYTQGYFLDDEACFAVAELLDLNPAYVVACVNMERAEKREDERGVSFWMRHAMP